MRRFVLKSSCFAIVSAIALIVPGIASAAGAVGERVPASLFCAEPVRAAEWGDAPRLIVLMPARSDYASMLRLAFGAYFRAGQALPRTLSHERFPKVVFVTGSTGDGDDGMLSFLENGCPPAHAPEALAAISTATGTALPKADQADATVLLLDKDDIVRWRDDAYRAQGERLKPLEAAVKTLLGVSDPVAPAPGHAPPALGDIAPDFAITQSYGHALVPRRPGGPMMRGTTTDVRLSALRGKVVLLGFYPAAFSGTLPTVEGSAESIADEARQRERTRMMSCALQLDELDLLAPDHALQGDVVKLAISASTPELLDAWRRTLRTKDLHYVNDPDYAISRAYGSYDAAAGYNVRKVFVIDRQGRVAYVDDDYAPGDADAVAAALEAASKR